MAIHDGRLREALLLTLRPVPVEQLLGVRADVLDGLRERGVSTRAFHALRPRLVPLLAHRLAESRGAGGEALSVTFAGRAGAVGWA